MALNYASAYDFAARPGVDPEKAKEMAKAYQYRHYGSRPEDTIQDYYENVEGINAFTGQRMSDEDLLRQAYEFARQRYEAAGGFSISLHPMAIGSSNPPCLSMRAAFL